MDAVGVARAAAIASLRRLATGRVLLEPIQLALGRDASGPGRGFERAARGAGSLDTAELALPISCVPAAASTSASGTAGHGRGLALLAFAGGHGGREVLVTLGERGVTWVSPEGSQHFAEGVRHATKAAAICVTRPGAQAAMPSREEVERFGA